MNKCANLDCNKKISSRASYCSMKCRSEFPPSAIKINKYIKAKSLEEFYRKFYIIFEAFPKKDLCNLFGVSHPTLLQLKASVFKYTTYDKIEKYKRGQLKEKKDE